MAVLPLMAACTAAGAQGAAQAPAQQPLRVGRAIANSWSFVPLDVGVANVATIAQAHNRGLPFSFIAPGALATPTSMTNVMMVAKDSPIRTAADLNGKTIAINALKDLQQISVQSWIDKHGGD